ncbi:SDR family oxidoreductase [Rhodopila sp.]|uniref:SDR family oxidoreductase n=1 Tax=Rhodopila sp. TaxID=2480087 RepID=UPI003D0F2852
MRIFVTGATGWVGSAITRELIGAGYQVIGLVRSGSNSDALAAMGATPVLGSLDDIDILRKAAGDADGVIHTAFGVDFSRIVEMSQQERRVIEIFGEVYEGSDRPIIATSGFGLLPAGERFTEETPPPPVNPAFPRAPEQAIVVLVNRGVRATVVRLPRSVHGRGERHGFVPMLAGLAREKGVSAYPSDGDNLWPSVHRLDAAHVFCLALKHGAQGGPFHAVADEGVRFRQIAEAIGRQLGLPTQSLTAEKAAAHFGPLAMWVAGNGPASSQRTRERLAWEPEKADLISDIDHPDYFA